MRNPDALTTYERATVRAALLDAQSEWLEEADRAETPTLRTVATVIADAFSKEAEFYTDREAVISSDLTSDFFRR